MIFMSLRSESISVVPEKTARLAYASFPKDNPLYPEYIIQTFVFTKPHFCKFLIIQTLRYTDLR